MNSIITTTISMLPSMFTLLIVRAKRDSKASKPAYAMPPKVLSNLPQVDMVDIRAMLRKWED